MAVRVPTQSSEFLNDLMRRVEEEDRKRGDSHFLFELARACLEHLAQRQENRPCHYAYMHGTGEFFPDILCSVMEASASTGESDALMIQFTIRVVNAALVAYSNKSSKRG